MNARYNHLELTWRNFNDPNGYIVLAEDYPISAFQRRVLNLPWVPITFWEYSFGRDKKRGIYSVKPTESSGWIETCKLNCWVRRFDIMQISSLDVTFNRNVLDKVDFNTGCYGYYGYFVDYNGSIKSVYCMKLHPTWMSDQRSKLGRFRLRELFIPGTHDSSSYREGLPPLLWDTPVNKYSITQDDSIRDQLLQGARYIDLRPAFYPLLKPPFYANHGVVSFHPLQVILRQVRDYALKTNEIIILDAHEFPVGFRNNNVHDKLVQYLKNSLSDVLADPAIGWNSKLEDIWTRNRTVVLTYNDNYVASKYADIVWSPVRQRWGNVQNVTKLKDYLYGVHQEGASSMVVADMAELTATTLGAVTGVSPGLREMADSVNRHVTRWYFEDLGPTTNVVAVDFLRGTSIVDAALYWNLKKVT